KIVDVLGRAREVEESPEAAGRAGHAVELLPQEIFHGLDVVIGLLLERLDLQRVVVAEMVHDAVEDVLDGRIERPDLGQRRLVGEVLQPADFDQHSIANQRVFGQVLSKRRGLVRVAAIERRECSQRSGIHGAASLYKSLRSAHHTRFVVPAEPGDRSRITRRGAAVEHRIERDSMGELEVPADALWGAQTQRAVDNFPISGLRMPQRFIRSLGLIKWAAAGVNAELGLLPADIAEAIQAAALDVAAGRHDEHFPVDVFQTGSGTSSNMNANEVIARLASDAL